MWYMVGIGELPLWEWSLRSSVEFQQCDSWSTLNHGKLCTNLSHVDSDSQYWWYIQSLWGWFSPDALILRCFACWQHQMNIMNITPYMNCMALISHIIILKWLSNTQLYILYNHIITLYHVLYQLRIIFPRILWYFNVFQLILPGHPSNTTRILWHQGMGERTRERLLPLSTRRTVDIWWISVDKGIRMDQNGSEWISQMTRGDQAEIRGHLHQFCMSLAGCLDGVKSNILEAALYNNRQIEDAWLFLLEMRRRHKNRRKHVQECARVLGASYNWSIVLEGSRKILEAWNDVSTTSAQ
jgi:hypothetical protein